MKLKSLVFGLLLAASFNAVAEEKLVFAFDLIRHGDRTTIDPIPKAPHHWAEGGGQLTPTGMRQEFELGVSFRKKYIETYHLLPEKYDAETIYVRSSDFDRTIMSAQSLLLGLYPLGQGPMLPDSNEPALPSAFQPIPIHVTPQSAETLLIPDQDHKRFDSILAKKVFTRPDWKQKNIDLKKKLILWHQLSGMELNNIHQLEYLADALYVYQVHHVPYPVGISDEDAKEIIDAGRWSFATTYKTKEMGDLERPLLAVITGYLNDAAKYPSPLKYVLYSGHDSTILGLMDAMGSPLPTPPHYASNVNIALFKNDKNDYVVKVSFNGESVVIPACGGTSCSLSEFASLASKGKKK